MRTSLAAASIVKARLRRELGVVDVDDTVDEDQTKYVFEVDKQKAALNGVSTDDDFANDRPRPRAARRRAPPRSPMSAHPSRSRSGFPARSDRA